MTLFNLNLIKKSASGEIVKTKKRFKSVCSKKTLTNRFPIAKWLPSYDFPTLLQDVLAGATVGATAVAQGIAYAVIAGLPPEYGLYSGIMGGFVYAVFGNCQNMSIGPTAILSALIAKYVHGLSTEFAVLATFLAGVIQLCMGVFQLGFLVEFLSGPVVNGFVTAATIQIITSQLKPLFGTAGSSGQTFLESTRNFMFNIQTVKLWDTVLGLSTIAVLIILKKLGQGCSRNDRPFKRFCWYLALARNAVVVVVGMIIAYILHLISNNNKILSLVGDINGGLPKIQLPAFSATVGNETYGFGGMVEMLGPQSIVLPFVAILEVVVISKAFTPDANFDSMQEIIALGLCNLVGSFVGSMPVTGSFSRSALYNASGAQTPAAGIVVSLLIILSLSLLTSMFYFIPKSALAGLIIIAVTALVHVDELTHLWKSSKREFAVVVVTMIFCLGTGLEYGVIVGVFIEILTLLYKSARPEITDATLNLSNKEVVLIPLPERAAYCSGEFVRKTILRKIRYSNVGAFIIIDGTKTQSIDTTVASNLMSILKDVDERYYNVMFFNFKPELQNMCTEQSSQYSSKFVNGTSVEKLIESLLEVV